MPGAPADAVVNAGPPEHGPTDGPKLRLREISAVAEEAGRTRPGLNPGAGLGREEIDSDKWMGD